MYPAFAPQNQGLVLNCTKGCSSASGYELDPNVRQSLESLLSRIKNKKNSLIGLVGCSLNGMIGIQGVLDTTRHIFEHDSKICKIDGFYPVEDLESEILSFPHMWDECLNNFRKEVDVLCVLGVRNAGKSTFARFTLNSLLSSYESVAFLECDPGQSEFTPPGMVSLNIVSKPCIGKILAGII